MTGLDIAATVGVIREAMLERRGEVIVNAATVAEEITVDGEQIFPETGVLYLDSPDRSRRLRVTIVEVPRSKEAV